MVRTLLGADADARKLHYGVSTFHLAVQNNHSNVAQLLIYAGADPLQPTRNGDIPLVRAADWGHAECARKAIGQIERKRGFFFVTRILNGQPGDVYKLAKCLVYLMGGDAALAVFRQTAKPMENSDSLRYPMGYNGCRKRLRESGSTDFLVLVCRRCHDL
ncbi:uncharacterized protein BDV17DRAFT_18129 [Aspergillus undulatus]|uniref:uncharacterized protein n=1 Tax=Aspergillus undulatus TaxID=1810928 RepID=UPI003CCDB972